MAKTGFFKHFFTGIRLFLVPPPRKIDLSKFWIDQALINIRVHVWKERARGTERVLYFYERYKNAESDLQVEKSPAKMVIIDIDRKLSRFLFMHL